MEEKKLTDEELDKLIKALEYQSWAQNCPELFQAAYMLKYQKAEIERLNAKYRNLEINYNAVWEDFRKYEVENAEQKAEIERLTEEHERIAWNKQEYLDWVHGFLSTHTDMKDRGEGYKKFDREWMCGIFWAKIEGSIEYIIDLENQHNELQKQVDELTEENKKLSIKVWNYEQPARTPLYSDKNMVNCDLVTCYNENADLKAKNAELQKQVNTLKAENTELHKEHTTLIAGSILKQQDIVKDTAKEICDLILEHWEEKQFVECDWLRVAISERYGVEVE